MTVIHGKSNCINTRESSQLLLSLYMCHIAYAVVILQTVLWRRQWCQWYANDSIHFRSFAFNLSSQLATPCCDEELSTSHCAMLAWTSCRPESSIEHQNGCWPTCSALIPAPCEGLFAHDLLFPAPFWIKTSYTSFLKKQLSGRCFSNCWIYEIHEK